jgi:type III pantothenate kinase
VSFLALDVGNTRLKWALYADARPGAAVLRHGAVFLETIDQLVDTDWRDLPAPAAMLGCLVAAAGIRQRVEEQLESWDLPPRWVVPGLEAAGVRNGYDHPHRLGADRWVALVGARQRVLAQCAPGEARPAVVVMVGTAVTVDSLDAQGQFLGGLILPGHGIMLRALEGGTAGLRVPTGEVRDFPTNTSDALTSGGTDAITGAIERVHQRLARRTGATPLVLMTGGAGWKVAPHLTVEHQLVESLIFDGLLALQAAGPALR